MVTSGYRGLYMVNCGYTWLQFGEYVRVGVSRKSCDFLPQQCLTMLRYHVNKFTPFVNVLFCTVTKDISA